MRGSDILLSLVAIIFPPAVVPFLTGCSCDLFINVLLTLLGYIPGQIHAFYLIGKKNIAEEQYGQGGNSYVGNAPLYAQPATAAPAPWAVPMDPNSQAHPHASLSPPNVAPGPRPSPGTAKAQFSGYTAPVHQNALPACAVDHRRPGVSSGPSNVAVPSGSGTGRPLSNVLEQPGDALPPPAYTEIPSSP